MLSVGLLVFCAMLHRSVLRLRITFVVLEVLQSHSSLCGLKPCERELLCCAHSVLTIFVILPGTLHSILVQIQK